MLDTWEQVAEKFQGNPDGQVAYVCKELHDLILRRVSRAFWTLDGWGGLRVVDIGAGFGAWYTRYLKRVEFPAEQYFGVEPCTETWQQFPHQAEVGGWLNAQYEPAKMPVSYDVTVMIGTIGMMPDPWQFLKGVWEWTEKCMIFTVLDQHVYTGRLCSHTMATVLNFVQYLSPKFTLEVESETVVKVVK